MENSERVGSWLFVEHSKTLDTMVEHIESDRIYGIERIYLVGKWENGHKHQTYGTIVLLLAF